MSDSVHRMDILSHIRVFDQKKADHPEQPEVYQECTLEVHPP